MRLPDTVAAVRIPPGAEYDAMFEMPPMQLAFHFRSLAEDKSNIVAISIRKIRGENDLTFIKERGQGSDAESDDEVAYPIRINGNADTNPPEVFVEMEDRISENGIEKAFCMMCLHDYIDRFSIECPNATHVRLYMAEDATLPTFTFHTIPGEENREYYPAAAQHIHHERSERDAVRERPMLYLNLTDESNDDESDYEDDVDPEEEGGDSNDDGDVTSVSDNGDGNDITKRQRFN